MTSIPVVNDVQDTASKKREENGSLNLRRWTIVGVQIVLIVSAYWGAFLLVGDLRMAGLWAMFLSTLPLALVVKLVLFHYFGLLRGWWRYVGMSDLLDISRAAIASAGILYVLVSSIPRFQSFPRSVWIVDTLLTLVVVGGARFTVRAYAEYTLRNHTRQRRVLIVGAGRTGSAIVRELLNNPDLDYNPVALVDDDRSKTGIKIHGVKVMGTTDEMETIIRALQISTVLIAISSVRGSLVEQILKKCRACNVEFKIVPEATDRIQRSASFSQVRNVSVEDLLGREPVRIEWVPIRDRLQGKRLLITGAGGSIGSELARQLARCNPLSVILFERSENDLFKLTNELSAKFPELHYVPVIGDILDVSVLREVLSQHRPHCVFHAAAYKHVPMMEANSFQAIANNIFGTYNVALLSNQYQVEDFVMISSDKAVRPTNIMGCTKRVAELIILGLQQQRTRFMAVRFGNVLGSNGSVLPTFQQQIAQGGPVTVTHPEVCRYFMTIPEAVQLVLQSCSMGSGGEIFVLEMGEPVRIFDLACNLIRLSGLQPEHDIPVVFTGLRPGEKLSEELMLDQEGLKETMHNQIRVLDPGRTDFKQVQEWLDELSSIVAAKNMHRLIACLRRIVPEYTPSPEVLSLCQVDRHDQALHYARQRAELTISVAAGAREAA